MREKTILITNDDGYESEGLLELKRSLSQIARVVVVAPSTEKSACGHSLTLTKPLKLISIDDDFYKCDDGTPSDCVYLALNTLFDSNKPDLVVSGINKGSNMGEDITYSGTAAGAMEGTLQGVHSIAISQVYDNANPLFDFELAGIFIQNYVKMIFKNGYPLRDREFLNINIPNIKASEYRGFAITQAGYRYYANDAHLHRNPRGEEYYWLGIHPLAWKKTKEENCDFSAIDRGLVSITPIQLNLTAHKSLQALQEWSKDHEKIL